jgi:hypothetical protein
MRIILGERWQEADLITLWHEVSAKQATAKYRELSLYAG